MKLRVGEMIYLGRAKDFDRKCKREIKEIRDSSDHAKQCCAYSLGLCTHFSLLSALVKLKLRAEHFGISQEEILKEMTMIGAGIEAINDLPPANRLPSENGKAKIVRENFGEDGEDHFYDFGKISYEKGFVTQIVRLIRCDDVDADKFGKPILPVHLWDFAQAVTYLLNENQSNQILNRKASTISSMRRVNANLAIPRSKKFKRSEAAITAIKKYEELALEKGNYIFTDEQREDIITALEAHKYAAIILLAKLLDFTKSNAIDAETSDYLFLSNLIRVVKIDGKDPKNLIRKDGWREGIAFEDMMFNYD